MVEPLTTGFAHSPALTLIWVQLSASGGWFEHRDVGLVVGDCEGVADGATLGDSVGASVVGAAVGVNEGARDGANVAVGALDGF
jgi:hypothetical protein